MSKQDWKTPPDFFELLWAEFGGFDLDPCCKPDDYTAKRVLYNGGTIYVPVGAGPPNHLDNPNILEDGLHRWWITVADRTVYMNPPYAEAGKWVKKAAESARAGLLVVALLMPHTDTRWFHTYIWDKRLHRPREDVEVRFLEGRLKFYGDLNTPIPAPRNGNMLVVFYPPEKGI